MYISGKNRGHSHLIVKNEKKSLHYEINITEVKMDGKYKPPVYYFIME